MVNILAMTGASGGAATSPVDNMQKMMQLKNEQQGLKNSQQALTNAQQENEIQKAQLAGALRKQSDDQDTRAALASNTTPDPISGKPVTNYAKTLADLTQKNPAAAMSFHNELLDQQAKTQQLKNEQLAAQKEQLAIKTATQGFMASQAGAVLHADSQEAYDRFKMNIKKAGAATDDWPEKWEEAKPHAEQIQQAGMTPSEQISADPSSAKNSFARLDKISRDYRMEKPTTEYNSIYSAAVQASSALKASKEAEASGKTEELGLSDKTILFALGKMENPGATVRLGTMKSLEDAASLLSKGTASLLGTINGSTLSPAQRKAAEKLMTTRLEDARFAQGQVDAQYMQRAIAEDVPVKGTQFEPESWRSSVTRTPNPFNGPLDKAQAAPKAETAPAATAGYQEGQTAINKKTGERMVFKGGSWQKQ